MPVIEFLLQTNGNASPYVQIGLWDNAWRDGQQQNPGTLYNDQQENQNFIGRDSRKFYIRVTDEDAAQRNAATVTVRWGTLRTDHQNNNTVEDDDFPQADLTLTGVPNTATYYSEALLLVTDDEDAAQATHSGLALGGLCQRGNLDHRLRRVSVRDQYELDGQVKAIYAHQNPNWQSPVDATVDIFQRNPDERKRLRVHFINVRRQANGPCATTNQELATYKGIIQAIYGRCGIFAQVDSVELDPPQSCTGWAGRYDGGEDPGVVVAAQERSQNPPQIVPHPTQTDLINQIQNRQQGHVYLFFVDNIFDLVAEVHAGGEAFYAAQTAHPPNLQNALQGLNDQIQAQALAAALEAAAQNQNLNRAGVVAGHLDDARDAARAASDDDLVLQAQAFSGHVQNINTNLQWLTNLIQTAQGQAQNLAYDPNQIANLMDQARGCAFIVRQDRLGSDFAPVHELTHITTDLNNDADGHFDLEAPAVPQQNQQGVIGFDLPGPIDGKNLMHRYALDAGNPQGVNKPKRLWNQQVTNGHRNNMVIPAQIQTILNSPFVGNY